jgi:enamine deaminase RidA (YjgF/YER057c/UK114 family)
MSIQHLHPSARFSEATIHQQTVYLAGQLAEDLSGDIRQQSQHTLALIDQLLAEANSDKSRILSCTIYLKDIQQDYAAFNAVWDQWVAEIQAPPRTCVEAKLYAPEVLVEITIIAAQR